LFHVFWLAFFLSQWVRGLKASSIGVQGALIVLCGCGIVVQI
jgi:hypothetical protein